MTEDPRRDRLRRRRVRVAGQPVRPRRPGGVPEGPPEEFTWAPPEPGPAAPAPFPPPGPDQPVAGRSAAEQSVAGAALTGTSITVGEKAAEPRPPVAGEPEAEPAPDGGFAEPEAAPPAAGPAAPGPHRAPDSPKAARAAAPFRRLALPVGLGSAAVALAVVVAILAGQVSAARSAQSARLPALAAAENAATALLSVNYTHLSQDVARANAYLTPSFRTSYDRFRANFAPTYQKYRTVIIASVTAGGLRDVTGHSATALLFVDQITTGTNRTSPRIDQDRVRVSLVLRHGRWLVFGLSAL